MGSRPTQDSRKFYVLPQGYEGGGYYTYGSPGNGISQYAHPKMISLICLIAARWASLDPRKFGVGDISLANGPRHPDHRSHRSAWKWIFALFAQMGRSFLARFRMSPMTALLRQN